MDAHVHVTLVANRHDGFEEILHVGAELRLVDALVEGEELAELLHGSLVVLGEIAADETLRLDDDVLHKLVVFLGRHGHCQCIRLFQHVAPLANAGGKLEVRPLLACFLALEDVDVEIGKLGIVEKEVVGSVGVLVHQVGACPVEHGHEVVADGVYSFCRKVAQAFLIDLYLMVAVGAAIFYRLQNRQAFNHAPTHAVALDICSQVVDFLARPHFAKGHVVKCGDNSLNANLSEHGKGDRVFLAKPSPCFFHVA